MSGPLTRTCIATYIDKTLIEHEGAWREAPRRNQLTSKNKIKKAIDELYRIRQELKMIKTQDYDVSTAIKLYMAEGRLDRIEATLAYAELSFRPYNTVDAEAYFEAIDRDIDKLLATANIRLEPVDDRPGARSYLGEDTIKEITIETKVPVLNIKKIKQGTSTKHTPKIKVALA
jgi:hypothetical protein